MDPPSSAAWSCLVHGPPSRSMTSVSASNQSGSVSTSSPSMSNSTAASPICTICHVHTLKYLAAGWWTTMASVDCSGCSCISSESSTPIRSGCSSRAIFARSARSGQAG